MKTYRFKFYSKYSGDVHIVDIENDSNLDNIAYVTSYRTLLKSNSGVYFKPEDMHKFTVEEITVKEEVKQEPKGEELVKEIQSE